MGKVEGYFWKKILILAGIEGFSGEIDLWKGYFRVILVIIGLF